MLTSGLIWSVYGYAFTFVVSPEDIDMDNSQYSKFNSYKWIETFLNSKGEMYIRANYPSNVRSMVADFRDWCVMKDRVAYARNAALESYFKYTCHHRLNTRPRLPLFKAATGLKGKSLARFLGYSDANSFDSSIWKWNRVEAAINAYQLALQNKTAA